MSHQFNGHLNSSSLSSVSEGSSNFVLTPFKKGKWFRNNGSTFEINDAGSGIKGPVRHHVNLNIESQF